MGTDRPCGARRQFHLVDDDGLACIVYEQLHCFDDATASLVGHALDHAGRTAPFQDEGTSRPPTRILTVCGEMAERPKAMVC
jgi:hypothetical protein